MICYGFDKEPFNWLQVTQELGRCLYCELLLSYYLPRPFRQLQLRQRTISKSTAFPLCASFKLKELLALLALCYETSVSITNCGLYSVEIDRKAWLYMPKQR